MFQQQPAARVEVLRRAGDDGADRVQAIGAAGQGQRGFMAQGVQMRVALGHVRRVGDDGVEKTLRAVQPVPLREVHRQFQALCIGLRHGQRIGAVVQRVDFP